MRYLPYLHFNSMAPISADEAKREILPTILLTIFTCGIYGLFWQYNQFKTINAWLGREEHNFWTYLIFTVLTCGIYGIYYEYKFATTVNEVQSSRGFLVTENLQLLSVILAIFGLHIVTWSIEQQAINSWYENEVQTL